MGIIDVDHGDQKLDKQDEPLVAHCIMKRENNAQHFWYEPFL